jgi:hypothetical protein
MAFEQGEVPEIDAQDSSTPVISRSHRFRHLLSRLRECREWLTLIVASIAMAAAVYYACVARQQWQAMVQQVDLMRDSQRPWLGLAGFENIVPTTRVFTPTNINILAEGSYRVRNFSNAPAFAVNVMVVPSASVERKAPANEVFCPVRDTQEGAGQVIFPGTDLNFPTSNQLSIRTKDANRHFWLLGCIVYRDAGLKIHHTKFWLRTSLPVVSSTSVFESWGVKAD